MKKLVVTHRLNENIMELLDKKFKVEVANSGDPNEIYALIEDAHGIIVRIGYLDRKTIMSLNNLEVIGRTGVGVDNIDIEAASERGIPVVVTPGANIRSVAEHTLAFLLSLAKDLKINDMEMHKGNYSVRNHCRAFEIFGKTLGIIGFGNIGRELAKICSNIGMKILVYDPFISADTLKNSKFQYTETLDFLLKQSDMISIHVPLTKDTHGMIGDREFKLMKPKIVIVNCARGNIIDENALIKALQKNSIGGVGLDVFSSEPLNEDSPILKFDKVITTPHIAGLTSEAFFEMSKMVVEGVEAILNKKKWPYVANREAYENAKWK